MPSEVTSPGTKTRPGRCLFASCVCQRSTWLWVWPGGSDEAFADSRCECKRREDLRHRDLTALALRYPGARVGARKGIQRFCDEQVIAHGWLSGRGSGWLLFALS